jgi:hypothetical protein
MFIFQPFAFPFIWLFKWLATAFLFLSNAMYTVYGWCLGFSIWLNDITESETWPRD